MITVQDSTEIKQLEKKELCGVPHVVNELPSEVDFAVINAAIKSAISATHKSKGKIQDIVLKQVTNEDGFKTIQVKVQYYER